MRRPGQLESSRPWELHARRDTGRREGASGNGSCQTLRGGRSGLSEGAAGGWAALGQAVIAVRPAIVRADPGGTRNTTACACSVAGPPWSGSAPSPWVWPLPAAKIRTPVSASGSAGAVEASHACSASIACDQARWDATAACAQSCPAWPSRPVRSIRAASAQRMRWTIRDMGSGVSDHGGTVHEDGAVAALRPLRRQRTCKPAVRGIAGVIWPTLTPLRRRQARSVPGESSGGCWSHSGQSRSPPARLGLAWRADAI